MIRNCNATNTQVTIQPLGLKSLNIVQKHIACKPEVCKLLIKLQTRIALLERYKEEKCIL